MSSSGFVCNIFDFIAKKSTKSGEIIIEQDNFPRVFDDFFWDENENTNSKPHIIKYDLQGYTKDRCRKWRKTIRLFSENALASNSDFAMSALFECNTI
mgnify:CR=1 FL=1